MYSNFIEDSLLADIVLYALSITLGMYTAWFTAIKSKNNQKLAPLAILGLALTAFALAYLSINPTKLGPFIETSSNTYGIYEKSAE